MGFRDDDEAARSRLEALERDCAGARDRVSKLEVELEDYRSAARPPRSVVVRAWRTARAIAFAILPFWFAALFCIGPGIACGIFAFSQKGTLTWNGRAKTSTDPRVAVGAPCAVTAEVSALFGELHSAELEVECAGVVLRRTEDLLAENTAGWCSLHAAGSRAGEWRYAADCQDGIAPHVGLFLATPRRVAYVVSARGEIELELEAGSPLPVGSALPVGQALGDSQ